ncbi:hypothetical protein V5799_005028 [Amblyomma americanum]|uniref:BTB domain-containing protein n=1 Tax=Amblyomma americanum TaxID=6943 RepID=A0AAQ4D4F5_AMBAM
MRYMDLKAIVEFMYRGEVNVSQDNFTALLKTAESLKVIGLAGVTNEDKDSELVTSVDGAVDVKPVGVPRAESPPLRKRKRGRPRRRSPSDSNKSDSEDAPPAARIKAPDSPEIIEDGGMSSDRVTGLPAPSSSRTSVVAASSSPAVPSGAHHGSSVQASISQHTQDSIGDDVGECDDADFDVEPLNVMEESMTTEDVPVFLDVSSSQAPGDESQQSRHTGSTSDNRALVPVHPLLPSDISIASQVDIKPSPSSLIPYGDQTLSPVVAASPAAAFSGDGASTTMAVMDASGVPAIAGPSGYQQSTPFSGDCAPTTMAVMDASAVPAVAGPSGYQSSTPFSGDGASTAMAFVDKSGVPAIAGPSGYQQSTPSDGTYLVPDHLFPKPASTFFFSASHLPHGDPSLRGALGFSFGCNAGRCAVATIASGPTECWSLVTLPFLWAVISP